MEALTLRELQTLQYASYGHEDARIAEELGISKYTVKQYLSSAYEKLEVQNRTAAVALALRNGLFE